MVDYGKLIGQAYEAQKNAYAPYSQFCVGAALLAKNGKIYRGCNIENAAYSPSVCAERVALFQAVAEGVREFLAIAIVGGRQGAEGDYCPPCGVCRQVMAEFCDKGSFEVVMARNPGEYVVRTLEELLPFSFGLEL